MLIPCTKARAHTQRSLNMNERVHQEVKDYYGNRVQSTEDLLTNVCTISSAVFSKEAKEAKKLVHEDVLAK